MPIGRSFPDRKTRLLEFDVRIDKGGRQAFHRLYVVEDL
jgi:hypothetical protein